MKLKIVFSNGKSEEVGNLVLARYTDGRLFIKTSEGLTRNFQIDSHVKSYELT